MNAFLVMLKKEFREQLKTFRLPVVVIVFLLFGFLSPLSAKFLPELIKMAGGPIEVKLPTPTAKDAVDQLLKNLGQFGPLAAILLAMGSVATEKERGTAAFVLVKPLGRLQFLTAKFLGVAVTLGLGVIALALAGYFYTAVLFEALPIGGYLVGCFLGWLVILVFAAVTLLGSTVVGSAIAAGGLGLAAWLGLGLVAVIPQVGDYLPTTLFSAARSLTLGDNAANLYGPLLVSLAIIAASLGGAWFSFKEQEF